MLQDTLCHFVSAKDAIFYSRNSKEKLVGFSYQHTEIGENIPLEFELEDWIKPNEITICFENAQLGDEFWFELIAPASEIQWCPDGDCDIGEAGLIIPNASGSYKLKRAVPLVSSAGLWSWDTESKTPIPDEGGCLNLVNQDYVAYCHNSKLVGKDIRKVSLKEHRIDWIPPHWRVRV
jgi:hypothetical protein